jgi:hypothetical protein
MARHYTKRLSTPLRICLQCRSPFRARPDAVMAGQGLFCKIACRRTWQQDIPARFWEKVNKGESCWLWTASVNSGGYGTFRFHGKTRLAPVVAWELTYGPVPAERYICHRCDTPRCVNPAHLWLGTLADNNADMVAKGRSPVIGKKGSANINARLSDAEIHDIKSRPHSGWGHSARLAAEFGVSPATIGHILTGRSWTHVQ